MTNNFSSNASTPSDGRKALGMVLAVISVTCSILALVVGNQEDAERERRDSYTSCAVEHDETQSLLSDEEWCK